MVVYNGDPVDIGFAKPEIFGIFEKSRVKKMFFSNMKRKQKNLSDNFLGTILVHYQLIF